MSPLQKGKLERDIESHLGKIEGEIEEYAISPSPNNLFLFYWHLNHTDVLLTDYFIKNESNSIKEIKEYDLRIKSIEEKFNNLKIPIQDIIKETRLSQETFNKQYPDIINLIGMNNY